MNDADETRYAWRQWYYCASCGETDWLHTLGEQPVFPTTGCCGKSSAEYVYTNLKTDPDDFRRVEWVYGWVRVRERKPDWATARNGSVYRFHEVCSMCGENFGKHSIGEDGVDRCPRKEWGQFHSMAEMELL